MTGAEKDAAAFDANTLNNSRPSSKKGSCDIETFFHKETGAMRVEGGTSVLMSSMYHSGSVTANRNIDFIIIMKCGA